MRLNSSVLLNQQIHKLQRSMSSTQSSNDTTSSPREQVNVVLDLETFKIFEAQINSLHYTIASKLDALNVTADSTLKLDYDLKETQDIMNTELYALNQRISNVEKSIKSLEERFIDHAKVQNIAFAIEQGHIGSFIYYCYDKDYSSCIGKHNSKDLVTEILLNFRQGKSFELPRATLAYLFSEGDYFGKALAEAKKEFQDKLVDQVHRLTGIKPTIEFDSTLKKYIIYCT